MCTIAAFYKRISVSASIRSGGAVSAVQPSPWRQSRAGAGVAVVKFAVIMPESEGKPR